MIQLDVYLIVSLRTPLQGSPSLTLQIQLTAPRVRSLVTVPFGLGPGHESRIVPAMFILLLWSRETRSRPWKTIRPTQKTKFRLGLVDKCFFRHKSISKGCAKGHCTQTSQIFIHESLWVYLQKCCIKKNDELPLHRCSDTCQNFSNCPFSILNMNSIVIYRSEL